MKSNNEDSLDSIFSRVRRLHHHRAVALLEELGLNYGQPPILFLLWKTDGRAQTEFAQKLKLTPATITATLQRMEKAGWIERRPDPEDMRVSRVYLTPKGKDIQAAAEAKLKQLEEVTFKDFSEVEKALLKRFFLHMEENLTQTSTEN